MSGDVFGNGMLLSHHIQLVAAFDHRHVFLDPNPDPEAVAGRSASACSSSPARRGPTTTPRSSRAGGGVYPRAAKSIADHRPRCAARLGIDPAISSLHAGRADPRDAAVRARRPALQRRHRHLREGAHRDARRRRRQGQRRAARRRRRAALPRRSARAATSGSPRTGRVEYALARRPDQHRRDRQQRRRRHLRPRGEHQDPARRRGARRRAHDRRPQRAARRR